jgi:preprotein translocase subunit YajC
VIASFAEAQKGGSPLGSFVILIPLLVAFYFVAIRPSRRRMQAMQTVQQQLAPGREVVTTAGLYGTVTEVDDAAQTITLEIAPGVVARFARGAVMKVVDEVPVPDGTEGTDG